MVRVRRGVEVSQMARNTGRTGQVVVAIHVALRALQVGVRAGQRESS